MDCGTPTQQCFDVNGFLASLHSSLHLPVGHAHTVGVYMLIAELGILHGV
jgi:hypothetical protein